MTTLNLNQNDIRVYFRGNSAKIEHISTGYEVAESSLDCPFKNYLKAWLTLNARMKNQEQSGPKKQQ